MRMGAASFDCRIRSTGLQRAPILFSSLHVRGESDWLSVPLTSVSTDWLRWGLQENLWLRGILRMVSGFGCFLGCFLGKWSSPSSSLSLLRLDCYLFLFYLFCYFIFLLGMSILIKSLTFLFMLLSKVLSFDYYQCLLTCLNAFLHHYSISLLLLFRSSLYVCLRLLITSVHFDHHSRILIRLPLKAIACKASTQSLTQSALYLFIIHLSIAFMHHHHHLLYILQLFLSLLSNTCIIVLLNHTHGALHLQQALHRLQQPHGGILYHSEA